MPVEFLQQNLLLVSIVVVSGLGLVWQMLGPRGSHPLSAAEATQLINREDALVVDVREPAEFAAGHLPDARNVPLAKLAERLGELEKYRQKPVIVCCAGGLRAGKAVRQLKQQGFARPYSLTGGVDAWISAGYPVKKGSRDK